MSKKLKLSGRQIAWMTEESFARLAYNGGNDSRGTVPVHRIPSSTAKIRIFVSAADYARFCEWEGIGNASRLAS